MTQNTKPKPQPRPAKTGQAQKPQVKTSSFDAEIALYEKELGAIIGKMEKTSQRFVASTIACLARYYPKKARTCVQERYELSQKLGIDRIRQMKQRIAHLIQNMPSAAQKLLCDGNLWWHKSRGGGWQDHYTQGPPDGLAMAIWALEERLTPILQAYGYIKKEPKPEKLEKDATKDAVLPRKKPKKADSAQLEWTEEMTKCIDSYKEDLGRATFLDSKMQQARKRKAIHIAGLLWDKA